MGARVSDFFLLRIQILNTKKKFGVGGAGGEGLVGKGGWSK